MGPVVVSLIVATLGRLTGPACAAHLPSVHARGPPLAAQNDGTWWAHVGGRTYFPPAPNSGLSAHVSDYYATLGSHSALTEEMKTHRVGGEGRWHILHLPRGTSMLPGVPNHGNRRSSFSALIQLRHGTVLSNTFPAYEMDSGYQAPPSGVKTAEESAVAKLAEADVTNFLSGLTALQTRSYSNGTASRNAREYLKHSFEQMGLHTCVQEFTKNGVELGNVIASVPGSTADSVTVGAHYDSRPFSGAAPGANDNGSGVAALLAIAKAFTQADVIPEKTVYFVGFGGEEPGLWGSDFFAEQLKGGSLPAGCGPKTSLLSAGRARAQQTLAVDTTGHSPHRAIIMDEVGWVSPKITKPTVNLESFDWTEEVMQHMGQASRQHNGEALALVHNGAPFGSDHMSFLRRDMPAVLAINGDDEAYPAYHQSSDTQEKVTPGYVLSIAKMCLGGLVRLSGVRS